MATPLASYILDGNSDYVTVADHADLDADTHISYGIWVKLDYDAVDSGSVYLFDRAAAHSMWIDEGRRVHWYIYDALETPILQVISKGRVPLDQPVFIVGTATEVGATLVMKIYIEGVLDNTATFTATMPAAVAAATYIGAYRTPSGYLKGTISSAFMTDDLVTAAEVLACYVDADGDHTGNINNLGISIITATEANITNTNGSAGAGTGVGTAAARDYMDLIQSMEGGNVMLVGEAMTRYNTHQPIKIKHVKWHGDTIADNDQLTLTN